MPTTLLAIASLAWAADPTEQPLGEIIHTMAPQIEAIAGRSFGDDLPTARWVKRREYRDLLLDSLDGGGFDDVHRDLPEGKVSSIWIVLGQYLPHDDEILLVEEQLEALRESHGLDDAETESMFRCLLVHELTHALDARHGEMEDLSGLDIDQQWGVRLLGEGHASWVEREWCRAHEGPEATARTAWVDEVASSLVADDPRAAYSWGTLLVDALYADDPESFWDIWGGSEPLSFHLAQMALSPVFLPGWTDSSPIVRALRGLGFVENQGVAALPLVDFLDMIDLSPPSGRPRAVAGLRSIGGHSNFSARVMAFALEGSGGGQALIDARAAQARAYKRSGIPAIDRSGDAVAPIQKVSAKAVKSLEKRGVVAQLITFKTTFRPFHELWAAKGDRLVVVETHGLRVGADELENVANQLLEELPPETSRGSVWLAALDSEVEL